MAILKQTLGGAHYIRSALVVAALLAICWIRLVGTPFGAFWDIAIFFGLIVFILILAMYLQTGTEKSNMKSMNIRASAAGEMQLTRPQQEWNVGRGGNTFKLQVASFAGQELMAITDDNGGFELHYLGFTEGPYPSMDQAKAQAPKFALAVLDVLKSKITI